MKKEIDRELENYLNSFEEDLDTYLKNNGIEEIPTDNKKKLIILRAIVEKSKIDRDVADIINEKNKSKGIADPEFLPTVQNLEVNICNGIYHIGKVKYLIKKNKKAIRKEKIKKFLRIK